ncbi:MAG: hypothetical protein JO090_08990 [Rhizobacter sp.]|nr:hypothetical protein [Rhizobacter sp.]
MSHVDGHETSSAGARAGSEDARIRFGREGQRLSDGAQSRRGVRHACRTRARAVEAAADGGVLALAVRCFAADGAHAIRRA